MLRWLGSKKASEPPDKQADHTVTSPIPSILQDEEVTDDPLASFETGHRHHGQRQIYSVSRSVFLPRVSLKNSAYNSTACDTKCLGEGINPLFEDGNNSQKPLPEKPVFHSLPGQLGQKSNSSGYGGSHGDSSLDPLYVEQLKNQEDAAAILEQNSSFVKSIKVATRKGKNNKSVPSSGSGSSGSGTLTTIPEGKVDLPVPKPIWPRDIERCKGIINYDSIVDDALLLYTSLNYVPDNNRNLEDRLDISVREILVELLNNINATMEGKTDTTPEEVLKLVNEKIALSIEALKISTEEEMRKLCINLRNCKKINSVLRAFSNSSSSGNSSQSSPEWNSDRQRTLSSETEDIYQIPSGSSSSGFSDYLKEHPNTLPVFVHEDLSSVPNGVRNAMIYGTLYRAKSGSGNSKFNHKDVNNVPKKSLLRAANDNKPSVWEQYYGVKAVEEGGDVKYVTKPTDVPLFPGGRPEADFTLDVPRSEMLSKRMKRDKKWRCRCRLLTSFLGLVFFLLSVMAVSLILTRGKRMFGSMM